MSVTVRLAAFAVTGCGDAEALGMMRLSVLDWAACGMAGVSEPVSILVRDMVLGEGADGCAALFGGGRAPARGAALVNGTVSHALDYDDTHFAHIGHPSVAVVSAALATAQQVGASGEAFLQACLIGVEASTRIGVWLGRGHYQMGFHQTGTAGCFGAAMACARLLGCDAGEMRHAIGLAATKAAGLKAQFGTMGKPYNAGAAAAAGVEVALLAKAGFVSNPAALEGPLGFGETHGGANSDGGFEAMGEVWMIDEISHKYHACCHGTHAMIEALHELPAGEVSSIEVLTNPRWLSVCDKPAPETGLEAKFSYRLIAALVLLGHDTARLDTFSDALAAEASLCALRDKVAVVGNDAIAETACGISAVIDGKTHTAAADISASILLETREAKLMAKAQALIGDRASALKRAVLDAGSVDVAGLSALISG